jgi:hypothetical protein
MRIAPIDGRLLGRPAALRREDLGVIRFVLGRINRGRRWNRVTQGLFLPFAQPMRDLRVVLCEGWRRQQERAEQQGKNVEMGLMMFSVRVYSNLLKRRLSQWLGRSWWKPGHRS